VEPIRTVRLKLEPLRVDHADELAPALDDGRLHAFIGGRPASVDELRDRYARQVVGQSTDGTYGWFNWIVRLRETGTAVGTVQATLSKEHGLTTADIAWIVAVPYQGRGYAGEAAAAMTTWLQHNGADILVAHIDPDHGASIGVARHLGLRPSDIMVDGETRWTS